MCIRDRTKLCEFANVEVDLSLVDEHIECFNEDESYDGIFSELKPNKESDDEESKSEDIRNTIEPIELKDTLLCITKHRALASELDNTTSMNLLAKLERKYEN